MWHVKSVLVLGCFMHCSAVLGLWSCTDNIDCDSLVGSVCTEGQCACAAGQEPVLGGTRCADLATYHTSTCFEDHQCNRLVATYQCRRDEDAEEGSCLCQSGHHYFLGRCWPTANYGDQCTRDEQCLGILRDPYSLSCRENSCSCADGYYSRQREECRFAALAVGDSCVIDEDCRFEGGACDLATFRCYDVNDAQSANSTTLHTVQLPLNATKLSREGGNYHGAACNALVACQSPFVCGSNGACVCPVGYYASGDLASCLAELGSPSTPEQCVGLFAETRDGVCLCPANFYYEENMRDCIKVTRRITDSCVTDSNCHTFGAASRCGEPQEPWSLRTCECIPEFAVWDSSRDMCRLFAGIGEFCEVDSDCLAGDLEIQCAVDSSGVGYCACPEGLVADGGLCLNTGLAIGEACQASQECTGTENTVCDTGFCSCGEGYQEDDGSCAPTIGGTCTTNSDCVIANTVCLNNTGSWTCQCDEEFVTFNDVCWPVVSGHNAVCNVTAQCVAALGPSSVCMNEVCACADSYHYRDGGCWHMINLFETCTRTSECYLGELSSLVVCRNSLCQCDFDYPYSETEHTCLYTSSATSLLANLAIIVSSLCYVYTHAYHHA